MAETLVNLLLERLASVTINKIGRELKLVTGVDDEVANLSRNLKLIRAVLQDAEERHVLEASMGEVTGASVGDWLNELNQVSHEMDDVLDEWCTEILKQQLLDEQEGVNPTEALEIPKDSNKGGIIKTARTKEKYLTLEECFSMEVKVADEMMELSNNNNFRHFTLMCASQGIFSILSSQNCGNLRTFTTFTSTIYSIEPEFITSQLKRVRALNLSDTSLVVVPKEVGELLHLRYLDLSHNLFTELPDKIGDLYNLQTLRLVRCYYLVKLPDMRKLINLKHLYVKRCWHLNSKGISRLKWLETLDEFHVNNDIREGLRLEDLENLDKLQGALSMLHSGSSLQTLGGALRARLNKKRLRHLELNFDWYGAPTLENEGAILNALKPHPDLESLSILHCYGATSTPTWLMSLPNLKWLILSIRQIEVLPALGTLSFLESLDISFNGKLQKVGVEFLGIDRISSSLSSEVISFPKLKHLTFCDVYQWEEWEGVDSQNIRIMPCLSSLEVRGCEKLKALPEFLWKTPLKSLTIVDSPILRSVYYGGNNIRWTTYGEEPAPTNEGFNKISHIPNITIGYERDRRMRS
ncbi:putative disease resistance protein RGA4 isoform X2 [Rosa rugosa]|uniref:putative disease resistance protein RGA4 isoform X2 n=1 Tax=Rosa rugosa TaxID=74645 RepID=UPI002B416FC3|nr:putative disease resistance protein RGA4 isoform X2 [Rosa rugosa]